MIDEATQELFAILEPMGDGVTSEEKAKIDFLKGRALDASESFSPEAEKQLSRSVLLSIPVLTAPYCVGQAQPHRRSLLERSRPLLVEEGGLPGRDAVLRGGLTAG